MVPTVAAHGARLHENAYPAVVRAGPAHGHAAAQQDARARAETARRTLQQLQQAAQAAGTAGFGDVAELMGEAAAREQAGQAAFGSGDFAAALTDFEAALQAIQRAVAATATATTAARQQAEAAGRGALEAVAGASAQIESGRNLERRGRFNDARLAYLEATSMYEGPTATAAAPGSGSGSGAESVLLAVLQRYEVAMETEDIAAYRALWVNINHGVERAMINSFQQFESWQIEYSETEVVARSEETATVQAIQSLRFVDAKTGNPVEARTRSTFKLRKSAGTWLIDTLTQESIQ
jgi:tetratricopeptide (TPR) repeat protein